MTRDKRIISEGAVYHIFQRGNNKNHIFENPKHKAFLIKQIKEYNALYDFQLLAYVIMDNHYHLLIRTNKTPISEIMFNINNVIGKYLNRELQRTGHIFESRCKSKMVYDEAYLIWLVRYIHRNPVRANICKTPDEYRWSSNYFYNCGINGFVNTDFIFKIISNNKTAAISQYKKLVGISEGNDQNTDFENIKHELGLNESSLNYEENQVFVSKMKSLEEILNEMNIDVETQKLLTSGSKKRNITVFKIKFIQEAIRNKHTLKEIGKLLNTSQSAISNIIAYQKGEGASKSNI